MKKKEKTTSIMIVEDDPLVALDLEVLLRKFGYSVSSILEKGEDAVIEIEKSMPDIILMDIRLKGEMDGIEAVTLIQKKFDIPVIYATSHTDMATMNRVWNTQPFGYITKPIKERELYAAVEIALYKHDFEKNLKKEIDERKTAEKKLTNTLIELELRQKETSALLTGTKTILENRSFIDTSRSIFDSCKKIIGASAGYVALLSKDGSENEVLFLDAGGRPCNVDPLLPMPIRGLRETAYRSKKAVYENNFPQSPWQKFMPGGHVTLDNVMFAPLTIEEDVMGVMGLANKPGGFNDNDQRTASAFAELAAIALLNSRTRDALETSEEKFRAVTETANDAIITINSSDTIILWNEMAEKIFGYSPPEALGRPVLIIIPERFREKHLTSLEHTTKTGKGPLLGRTTETVGMKKNGEEFPIELSLSRWNAEDEIFYTAIIRDITAKKMAEEQLLKHQDRLEELVFERTSELKSINEKLKQEIEERRQAEEARTKAFTELEQIFESSSTGISIIDMNRNIVKTNRTLLKLFNIKEEDVIGEKCYIILGNHACNTDSCPLNIISQGKEYFKFEFEKKILGGEKRSFLVTAVPFKNARGEMTGILENCIDITAIKRLQQEIITISEEERHRIGRDLHDGLGQILTGAAFLLETIEKKIKSGSSPEIKDIQEVAKLIDESILTARSLSRGLTPVRLADNSLEAALIELASETERLFGIKCAVKSANSYKIFDTNTATHLYYIVKEALNNAIKHGRAKNISIDLKEKNSEFAMTVIDDGTGPQMDFEHTKGSGLKIMKYRAEVICAGLELSGEKKGFSVKLRMKLNRSV